MKSGDSSFPLHARSARVLPRNFIGIAGACCAAVLVGFDFSNEAVASCGDWLADSHSYSLSQPNMYIGVAGSAPVNSRNEGTSPTPRTCHGPQCQPTPSSAPHQPISRDEQSPDRSLLVTNAELFVPELSRPLPSLSSSGLAGSDFRYCIERPPRA